MLHSIWPDTEHQSLRLSWQDLHPAASNQLTVLPPRQIKYGGQAFANASPFTWNSLPKHLPHLPIGVHTAFQFSAVYLAHSSSESINVHSAFETGNDVLHIFTFYITVFEWLIYKYCHSKPWSQLPNQ